MGSRLGTSSTSVTAGASLTAPAGSAFRQSGSPLGILSRPGVHCHGLVNLEPLGYKFMALWTVYEMARFFVTLDGKRPCDHAPQVPAVRSHDSGCASPSVH